MSSWLHVVQACSEAVSTTTGGQVLALRHAVAAWSLLGNMACLQKMWPSAQTLGKQAGPPFRVQKAQAML